MCVYIQYMFKKMKILRHDNFKLRKSHKSETFVLPSNPKATKLLIDDLIFNWSVILFSMDFPTVIVNIYHLFLDLWVKLYILVNLPG